MLIRPWAIFRDVILLRPLAILPIILSAVEASPILPWPVVSMATLPVPLITAAGIPWPVMPQMLASFPLTSTALFVTLFLPVAVPDVQGVTAAVFFRGQFPPAIAMSIVLPLPQLAALFHWQVSPVLFMQGFPLPVSHAATAAWNLFQAVCSPRDPNAPVFPWC